MIKIHKKLMKVLIQKISLAAYKKAQISHNADDSEVHLITFVP